MVSAAPGMESTFEHLTLDEVFPGLEIVVTDPTGKVLPRLPGSFGPDAQFQFHKKVDPPTLRKEQ